MSERQNKGDLWKGEHNFKGVEIIKDILCQFLNVGFGRGNNVIQV